MTIKDEISTRSVSTATRYPQVGLVVLAFAAFIALGMPDGLLGVAWPSIRTGFSIPLDALGMLLIAGVCGYMTSSFFSGPLISRLGIGKTLAVSCALTGAALTTYTIVPAWWMMVLMGIVAGLGAGAIDAGLNNYVAAHFSERVMQWLHASYGIGITLGPIIMTFALSTWQSWRVGYRAVGAFQFLMALCFAGTLAAWNHPVAEPANASSLRQMDYKTPMAQTLRLPRAWLSALLFFVYVGAEVSLGTWSFSLLTESRGIGPASAGLVTGSYWLMFTIGRIAAGFYARKAGVNLLVQGSVLLAFSGAILLVWNPSQMANLLAVALIGFAIAPIFPALISGTGQRVSVRHATNTIGMQMAASGLGTAIIPALLGVLADQFSLEIIPVCMAVIYVALFVFYRISMSFKKVARENEH